jgi:hypothetical protein
MKSLLIILIVLLSLNVVGKSTKNNKCSGVICALYCYDDFKKNADGCPICSCNDINDYWNQGQANTIKENRFELGIFQPLRYGLTKNLELSTYPLINFVMPNIAVKKNWLKEKSWSFSTEHFISYPTLLLQLVSREGIAGLLPETAKENIPQQIYTEHSLIFTYNLSKYFVITPKVSVSIPIIFNSYKKFPTIDMFLLYTRTAPFHGDFIYTLSLDIDGKIYSRLYYSIDFDYYNNLPINIYNSEGIASTYEHKFMLVWKHSLTFSIYAGYKFIYGNYPYGSASNLVPLLDLAWAW